jgi:FkbM family methyltransferase
MDHNYTKYRELKTNDTVLILGAYDGDFIREKKYEILEKNIFVINIEPDIRLCQIGMNFILKEMPLNATFLNIAVSNKTGISVFKNCKNTLISSLADINRSWPEDTEFETRILTLKLDDLINMYNPDCIFCDIEGAELEVFGDSEYFVDVDYIAIAAYHIRNGFPTFVPLRSYFDKRKMLIQKIIIDNDNKKEEVLYIV